MLESFLAQILSDVYRRPRLALHVVIVFTTLILLKCAGIYLPSSITHILGLGTEISQSREALIAMDLTTALTALFIYLILVTVFLSLINKALNKALENLDLRDSFSTIDRLRSSCFVKDIVFVNRGGRRRKWSRLAMLSSFSIATVLSYYSSIAFFLYTVNDWLDLMGIPFLSFLSSSRYIALSTVAVLTLIAAILILTIYLQWDLSTGDRKDRGIFEEWLESLIRKYLLENCMGRRSSIILASLTPLIPKHRLPYLRYFTLVIPYTLAKARFENLANSSQYLIANYEAFEKCISRSLAVEDLEKGLFRKLCMARLYMKANNEQKYLGMLIAFTTTIIVGQRVPLRHLSECRAVIFVSPEEKHTYIAIFATDPLAAEFITRLVTG